MRLSKKVSVRCTGTELWSLLAKVGGSEVRLKADEACARQRLQIQLNRRTVRELMGALSELIDGNWAVTPGGTYTLRMRSGAERQRKEWWATWNLYFSNRIAAQRQALLTAMRNTPKPRDPNVSQVEHDGGEGLRRSIVSASLFNTLQPSVQEKIADRLNDYSLYTGLYDGTNMDGAVVVPIASLSAAGQAVLQNLDAHQYLESFGNANTGRVIFVNTSTKVHVFLSTAAGDITYADMTSPPVPRSNDTQPLPFEHRFLPAIVAKLGRSAPSTWKQLAKFQEKRVWPNDVPVSQKISSPRIHSSEYLYRLAAKANIEFIADYYDGPSRQMTQAEFDKPVTNIKEELDIAANDDDSSWKSISANLFLFRNNRWYRDDAVQVAQAVVDRLEQLTGKYRTDRSTSLNVSVPSAHGGLKDQVIADSYAVGKLSPWQITRGLMWHVARQRGGMDADRPIETLHPMARFADRVMRERRIMQAFEFLDSGAKEAAINGNLRMSSLYQESQAALFDVMPFTEILKLRNPSVALAYSTRPLPGIVNCPAGGFQDYRPLLVFKAYP